MEDIRRQAGIAIRWLPLILIGALVAGAIAFTVTSAQPNVYEAEARLLVDPGPEPSLQDLVLAESAAVRYADQARSRPVLEAVIDELDLTEGSRSLQDRIETNASGETLEVVIEARGEDPAAVRALALAIAVEMRTRSRKSLVTSEVKAADDAIAANKASIRLLQNRLDNLRKKANKDDVDRLEIIQLTGQISGLQRDIQLLQPSSLAYVRNRLEWSDRPVVPDYPVEPRPMYWTLLALVAGGMLAVAIAFVLEYLRTHDKIRDELDLEEFTGVPTLGSVFEKRGDIKRGDPDRLVLLRYPGSESAESYRGLLAQIGFSSGATRTVMVASADPFDGKGAVAANLATAYAEAGRNVILVDADYRSPRQHSFFGVRNDRGLTNMMVDRDVPLSWVMVPTAYPRLHLVPGGPPPPRMADAFSSAQVEALLERLTEAADMVVFDSPAMSGSLNAAVLAAHLQEAVLVVPAGSKGEGIVEATRALQRSETEVVGAVLYRQVRGAHKRTASMPIVAAPGGPPPPPPNVPPRRIPAAVTSSAPPVSGQPASSSAGQAQFRPPAPSEPRPPGSGPPRPPVGPYAQPFEPGDVQPDG